MCGCIWFILVLVFLLQLMQILGSRFTTQSLLLLEKQSGQTLEMTAEDCVWQTKTENGWRKVQPELLLQGAASVDAWQKQQKQCFTHADMGALTCCFDAQKYLFEVFLSLFLLGMFGHAQRKKQATLDTQHVSFLSHHRHIIVTLPRTSKKLISTPAIL